MSTPQALLEANAALRHAVESRLAGCRPAQEAAARTLADADPPPEVAAMHPGATWTTATPIPAMTLTEPVMLSRSLPPEQLEATARAMRPRDRGPRLIGLAGRAGAGKNLVASMIPGAATIGFADPLYAMLAAMLGCREADLRRRDQKERPVAGLGKSARELLQTLGTEWGRQYVAEDVWLRIAERRIEAAVGTVVISDVRFDNEAEWIRGRGGEVWHLRRPGLDTLTDHASEAGVEPAPAEPVIVNDGTVEDLRRTVENLLSGRA